MSLLFVKEKEDIQTYVKVKTLARGSYGQVKLVKRTSDNGFYVIKKITVANVSEERRNYITLEVQVLSKLVHPNVIAYHGCFVQQRCLHIIMEFADGGTLGDHKANVKKKGSFFTEDQVNQWFAQLVLALSYIHSQRVVHGDLKLHNIFLTSDVIHKGVGLLKVGDFGLARTMNSRSKKVRGFVGTPHYAAPEVCASEGASKRSDMWSLGCILYELTSLTRPFSAKSVPAIMRKVTDCNFQALETMEHLKRRYASFHIMNSRVMRLLVKDPHQRATAQELKQDPIISKDINAYISMLDKRVSVLVGTTNGIFQTGKVEENELAESYLSCHSHDDGERADKPPSDPSTDDFSTGGDSESKRSRSSERKKTRRKNHGEGRGVQSGGDDSNESKGKIPSVEGGSFSKDESIIRTIRTMEESGSRIIPGRSASIGKESGSFIMGRSTLGSASGTGSFVQKYVSNEQSPGQGSSPVVSRSDVMSLGNRQSFSSSSLKSRKERNKYRDKQRNVEKLVAPLDLSLSKFKGGQKGSHSFIYMSKRLDADIGENSRSAIFRRRRKGSRDGGYRYISRRGEKDLHSGMARRHSSISFIGPSDGGASSTFLAKLRRRKKDRERTLNNIRQALATWKQHRQLVEEFQQKCMTSSSQLFRNRWLCQRYRKDVFEGRRLVDWIAFAKRAGSRTRLEAISIAEQMQATGLIFPADLKHDDGAFDMKVGFRDDLTRYAFQPTGREWILNMVVKWTYGARPAQEVIRCLFHELRCIHALSLSCEGIPDYKTLIKSEAFAMFQFNCCELQMVYDIDSMLRGDDIAFFINVYNILSTHALIMARSNDSHLKGKSAEQQVTAWMRKATYRIGKYSFSLGSIKHGILRRNRGESLSTSFSSCWRLWGRQQFFFMDSDERKMLMAPTLDPRIHFALVGSTDAPRFHYGINIDESLQWGAEEFCSMYVFSENVKGVNTLFLPSSPFAEYGQDFGSSDWDRLAWIVQFMTGETKKVVVEMITGDNLNVQFYDHAGGSVDMPVGEIAEYKDAKKKYRWKRRSSYEHILMLQEREKSKATDKGLNNRESDRKKKSKQQRKTRPGDGQQGHSDTKPSAAAATLADVEVEIAPIRRFSKV